MNSGGGGDTAPVFGRGVEILEVGPVYDYISSGEVVDFQVKFQNIGDQDVEGITAVPYLLSWDGFEGEKDYNQLLYCPNPELGREGARGTITWEDVQVPAGLTRQDSFKMGVRLYYDYATITTARVYALSSQAYAGYMERRQNPPTVMGVSNSMGPIQVDVSMDNVFITNAANDEVPVTLKFRNVGNGYPQQTGASAREYMITSVDIEEIGSSGISAINTADCDDVRMRGGMEGDCTVMVRVPDIDDKDLEIRLRIETKYTYVNVMERTIVVHPDLGG
ncbi:MAG: hypothetical protein ACP5E4_01410 [Candidatus Aenigmatarchaeota archaeon]